MSGHARPGVRRYLRESCVSDCEIWDVKGTRISNLRCSWMWCRALCY